MTRVQVQASVVSRALVAEGTHRLTLRAPSIARAVRTGQFVNVRVAAESGVPFLRRPFSVSRVAGDDLDLVFNVVGVGTRQLASLTEGEPLDLLGPLGVPFGVDDRYEKALLVAGGLGVAPMPLLSAEVEALGRSHETFLGARSAKHIYRQHLTHLHIATDDGSEGYHGTVVDLLNRYFDQHGAAGAKIFACGPTPMLKALGALATARYVPCELSLEGEMACGIGLCQGCPVETVGGKKRYALVCTDGPTFNAERVRIA